MIRLVFWKTNCSELWKRLQVPGVPVPAPAYVVSPGGNKSEGMPPAQAPSRLPADFVPGKLIVLSTP